MKRNLAAEKACRAFLQAVGYDIASGEGRETPRRLADLYTEVLSGAGQDIRKYFSRPLPTKHGEMIVIKDIEFVSVCEHHLWPFFGRVHIAYLPHGKIVGLSKFASAVRVLANRPQLQERMVTILANAIDEMLQPLGCMVIIEGLHTCMLVPGRYDRPGVLHPVNSITITSAVRGVFLIFPTPREEALTLIYGTRRSPPC